jgi:RNA-binding protein
MSLEGYQRRHLRGLAHDLKPVVQVGKAGLTPGVVAAIDAALEAHELIKVRLVGDKAEKRETVVTLEAELDCSHVGLVGHVVTLYREQPEADRRKIRLPLRDSAALSR